MVLYLCVYQICVFAVFLPEIIKEKTSSLSDINVSKKIAFTYIN